MLYNKRRCVGMADETDSKSVVSNGVWVQVPPPAPNQKSCAEMYKTSFIFQKFYKYSKVKLYILHCFYL